MKDRDRVKIYYAIISHLEIMTYVPIRAADCVLSDYQTGAIGAEGRRIDVSVTKMMGKLMRTQNKKVLSKEVIEYCQRMGANEEALSSLTWASRTPGLGFVTHSTSVEIASVCVHLVRSNGSGINML